MKLKNNQLKQTNKSLKINPVNRRKRRDQKDRPNTNQRNRNKSTHVHDIIPMEPKSVRVQRFREEVSMPVLRHYVNDLNLPLGNNLPQNVVSNINQSNVLWVRTNCSINKSNVLGSTPTAVSTNRCLLTLPCQTPHGQGKETSHKPQKQRIFHCVSHRNILCFCQRGN